jgi:diguanylate cyclase (GGDEF)-like protein/PAS domain S-box-containing protein
VDDRQARSDTRDSAGPAALPGTETLALAALEALPNANAIVFDTEFRYLLARGGAIADRGFRTADLEGREASEALGPELWAFYEPLYRAALQGETRSAEAKSLDGKLWHLVKVGPLRNEGGDIIGGISFAADITARKRAEERFDALFDAAPDAMIVVDREGRIVRVNSQTEVLFEYGRDLLLGQPVEMLIAERFRDAHPGHRRDFLADPHMRPMGLGVDIAGRRRDGSEFPVEINLGPLETDEGVVVSAAIRDLTDRKKVERDAAYLAAVVEYSHDAIIGKDLDGIVTSWNRGAERLYGYSEAEMRGKAISVLVPPGHENDLPDILDRVRLGERVEEYQTVRARKDGTQVDVSLTVSPVRAPDGTVIGASTIARDISGILRYQEQLRFLAEHDALTGARNRRRFERDLTEQVGRAHRYGEQAALLIIDIDGFKQINDAHGHQAGDHALKEMALVLSRRLRDTDAIARIGGDEFAVLLPYANENQATVVVKDLGRAIQEARVDLGNGTVLSLSASVGVVYINEHTASAESVFAAADRAMYENKRRLEEAGRPRPTKRRPVARAARPL